MVTLSYTLFDYTHLSPLPLPAELTTATSTVRITLTTNGAFPAGPDGWLEVSVEGISLGRLFDGDPTNDLFFHGFETVPDVVGNGPVIANLSTAAWEQIIADGQVEFSYAFGPDAGASTATDFISIEFFWRPAYQMVWGTDEVDNIDLHELDAPASAYGQGGDDTITGTRFGDQLQGGDGRDLIFGAEGDDRVVGNAGNDELSGGDGDDDVVGASGNDSLYGDFGNDKLRGGDGLDSLMGGRDDDFLWGGADGDWLFGDDGTDRLWGEGGNDNLDGGWGDDFLWGGEGEDQLWGNRGDNRLWGGDGADQFIFTHADRGGTQHVFDFDRTEGDKLVYYQDFDQVVDEVGIRVGKDGTVVTIADQTIIVSGVFDLTIADVTFVPDADLPWF
jgi:Ca2+-binding RTX toxin-like protein